MSKTLRVALLACALLSAPAAFGSPAGAVTWDNSGDTAFTATGGAMTFSGDTGETLPCTSSTSTGTAPASFAGDAMLITMTTTWHCTLVGIPATVHCHEIMVPTGQTGTPGHLVTNLLTTHTCGVTQLNVEVCHLHGFGKVDYINPTTGATPGRFTWTTTIAWTKTSGSAACPQKWHVPHLSQVITAGSGGPAPHTGPVLVRTP